MKKPKGGQLRRRTNETCPKCKQRNALSVWTHPEVKDGWLECDYCDYNELEGSP